MNLITGSFKNQDSAEHPYRKANEMGYTNNKINVVMYEETRHKYYGKDATLETEVGSNRLKVLQLVEL